MSGLDPQLLAAVRSVYVDDRPPMTAAVWEQIRPMWLPAYREAQPDQPCDGELPEAA